MRKLVRLYADAGNLEAHLNSRYRVPRFVISRGFYLTFADPVTQEPPDRELQP